MQLSLFDQVDDLLRALVPEELGRLESRAHRRGVKIWFDAAKAPREHYEAQLLGRRHVDGTDGMALEVGFHAEHHDPDQNQATVDALIGQEPTWRTQLGLEAEAAAFFGADGWRRVSEAWIEPDLEDEELAFEIASRLVDYVTALEPVLRSRD